eukprot:INCI6051.1.p1 GENE.INCI6051.1~~INCI6051.1.p1  ORF type:complete len:259 (-),score=36.77 INCI6051.1:792-1568(-)
MLLHGVFWDWHQKMKKERRFLREEESGVCVANILAASCDTGARWCRQAHVKSDRRKCGRSITMAAIGGHDDVIDGARVSEVRGTPTTQHECCATEREARPLQLRSQGDGIASHHGNGGHGLLNGGTKIEAASPRMQSNSRRHCEPPNQVTTLALKTAPIKFEIAGYPGLRRVSVPLPLRLSTIQRTLALSFPDLAHVFLNNDRVLQLLVSHQAHLRSRRIARAERLNTLTPPRRKKSVSAPSLRADQLEQSRVRCSGE